MIKKILTFLILSILISSCGFKTPRAWAKLETSLESGAIPPDFGKNNEVLLCTLSGIENIDHFIIRKVSDHYNGKVIFVTKKQLIKPPYNNIVTYRYYLDHYKSSESTFASHPTKTDREILVERPTLNCFMYDRLMKKKYNSNYTSNDYWRIYKFYAKNLEKVRQKNQNNTQIK